MHSRLARWAAPLAGSVLFCLAVPAVATDFNVVNLVTDDQTAHAAQITDTGLKNAWGISFSPTSPFWVSAADAGTSVLYRVNPVTQATTKVGLTVTISGNPTGQVFNSNPAAFNGDAFLFVSEDGSVSGWRGSLGTVAEVLMPASAANSYKGAAFATIAGNSYLYAANFHAGTVDVLKGSVGAPSLAGSFTDPLLPANYAPFNVRNLNGSLYVTYAQQNAGKDEEVAGAGHGIVDRFDLQGNLISRIATGGALDAPWGLAIAPDSFGALSGKLLVGNFGDGHISIFDQNNFAFLGQVTGAGGKPLAIDGLWALTPGNDGGAGSGKLLYFSAGPDEETHGLFGVLIAVPEPSTHAMLFAGLVLLGVIVKRRSHQG
jgi:uncharacterized protein (TIGR03118 family)